MSEPGSQRPGFHLGIGAWMVIVSLVASLPLLALLLGVTAWDLRKADDLRRASLQRQVLRTAALVQGLIDIKATQLRTVSVGVAARQGLHQRLHEVVQAVAATDPDIVSISLVDAEGRRLLDSRQPWGTALAPSGTADLDRQALARPGPSVSPLVKGSQAGRLVIGVAVPLPAEGGRPATLLRLVFDAGALSRLLKAQPMPEGWVVAVIDERGVIAARNLAPETFVGQPATDSALALIASGRREPAHTTTRDGRAALAVVAPVGGTGWHVALGAPEDAINEAERQTLLTVLGLGLLLALASIGVSILIGRRLADSVRAVARGDGDAPLPIDELGRIRGRFDAHAEAERSHAQQLQSARLDALTGLPGRGLFDEEARQRLSALADGEAMALLFIDLDGFKALNDSQGHEAGDRALQAVGALLRQLLRPQDLAARPGGDEFVVALVAPRSQITALARQVAARLREALPRAAPGLGCSIGLAVVRPGEELAVALARADLAMLTAKRSGKGRVAEA